ncbi:transporter, major facilitator family [Aciduliprofundum boonei T469]|nr:transporter, major facilitator family [Aciduliprofundum boonei T469]
MGLVLKNRNFLKLWIGQIVSNIGDEVAFFGLGVLVVFSWKGTALDLSIVMASSSLPVLLFGPFVGVFVDRWNKQLTMIAADLIRAFLALFFIFCTSVIQLAIVVFLLATVSRFFYPARASIIPEIMKEENLVEANSFSQMTYMLSVILGPVIATPMIYILGYTWIFIFDSSSYVFSAIMISLMIYEHKARKEMKKPLEELIDGLKYIWNNPTVRLLILIFSIVMLFVGGLNVAFSIYIRDVVHMGVGGYGALEVLFGIGTVVGSISTGFLAGRFSPGKMVLTGILGIGIMILILGILPTPWVALIFGGFMIGYFVGYLNAPATAIFQKAIKEEFRGRVFSAQGAIIQGATLISIVVIGLLINYFGIIPIILFSSSVLIFLSIALIFSKASKVLNQGE